MVALSVYRPVNDNLVLIALASSEGSVNDQFHSHLF